MEKMNESLLQLAITYNLRSRRLEIIFVRNELNSTKSISLIYVEYFGAEFYFAVNQVANLWNVPL